MFKALLRKQMAELLTYFYGRSKDGKPRSTGKTVMVILLMIFVFGLFAIMFFSMSIAMCIPLSQAGLDWLYFSIFGGMSLFLGVIGSVFATYNGIFVAKDNELLLSMPIKSHIIVFVRMLSLYIIALVFEVIVLIPAGIVYLIFGGPSVTMIIFYPLSVLILPFLSLTVSCLLGWVIALIVPHVRYKSIVTMVISVFFMVLYFMLCFKFGDYLEYIIDNIDGIAGTIIASAYPLYLLGSAMSGEVLPFLLFAAVSLVIFGVVYYLISKTFLTLSTAKCGAAKIKYEAKEMKVGSVKSALFRREVSHFFSSPAYMLNCGIGSIMLLLLAVFVGFKAGTLREIIGQLSAEIPQISGIIPGIICMVMSFIVSMIVITAPSVSLEGKTIWLVQSLPVRGRQVLQSKLNLHILFAVPPALICAIVLVVATELPMPEFVAVVLYSASYTVLGGFVGLIMNLMMPKLDFTNETVAVKQSGSVIVTMLIMMAADAIYCVLFLTTWSFIPGWITILGASVVNCIACAVMWRYLSFGGEKRFEKL